MALMLWLGCGQRVVVFTYALSKRYGRDTARRPALNVMRPCLPWVRLESLLLQVGEGRRTWLNKQELLACPSRKFGNALLPEEPRRLR